MALVSGPIIKTETLRDIFSVKDISERFSAPRYQFVLNSTELMVVMSRCRCNYSFDLELSVELVVYIF
jgi:hypothetical protein